MMASRRFCLFRQQRWYCSTRSTYSTHYRTRELTTPWGSTSGRLGSTWTRRYRLSSASKYYCTSRTQAYYNTCSTQKYYSTSSTQRLVLGIETSCDDTGAAVVNERGEILGEALHSQVKTHVQHGGIIPPIARDLHKHYIDAIVNEALQSASIDLQDLDAVAVSVEPGLPSALRVGLDKAVDLCKASGRPLIPIHHMKAHALTVRLREKIDFPFLVILASGGHCILALAHNVDEFSILGSSLDDAPGECLDKVARRLKLKNLPGFDSISGGEAIERVAVGGDPRKYVVYTTMAHRTDCNFSFSGLKNHFRTVAQNLEAEQNVRGDGLLNNLNDICASAQYSITHHIARRLQRAFLFCDIKDLLPKENRNVVLSGGVASNTFLRKSLEIVCGRYDSRLVCPPVKLCTDNGVMIAWNGMEKLMVNSGLIYRDFDRIDVKGRSPLGPNLSEEINSCQLTKLERIKLI